MKRTIERVGIGERLFDVLNFIFMVLIFIIMLYPFIYILSYSISDPSLLRGGLILLPVGLDFAAFRTCFSDTSILNGLYVSVARTILGSLGMVVITSMAGYVLTKNKLIGISFIRRFFVLTMYFSSGIIPSYILIKELHLMETFAVYIIPSLVNVFSLILIKTYIESIPESLEEAALIDGANEAVVFFKILFPVCKPVIAAVLLFACIGQWNSFIDTQLYNSMTPKNFSLQYVLFMSLASQTQSVQQAKELYNSKAVAPQSLRMAITIITVLPVILIYPFLQKYFISGLLIGSVKG